MQNLKSINTVNSKFENKLQKTLSDMGLDINFLVSFFPTCFEQEIYA